MTEYDWGLTDEDEESGPAPGKVWSLAADAAEAAKLEMEMRNRLREHLLELNTQDPPRVGDQVIPWTLLTHASTTSYPIVGFYDEGGATEYLVRLPSDAEARYAVYGLGDFLNNSTAKG